MRENNQHPIDPDFVAIATLVVSVLMLAAQVTDLKIPLQPRRPPPSQRREQFENLAAALANEIRSSEKLFRIFGNATTADGGNALNQRFRYGTRAFLSFEDFSQLQQLIGQLGSGAGNVGIWALHIILHDPEGAKRLGDIVQSQNGDIAARIREFYEADISNEQVLGDTINLLRQFLAASEQLSRDKN